MAGNSIGEIYRLTTFGESHGPAIGGIVDGCPSGFGLNMDLIQEELNKRKPGQSKITSQRKELDEVQFLSGIFEETTTGTPIGFIIKNNDTRPSDYGHIRDKFRPSHADYTYQEKYGIRDHRGGGRSSARETACRVVGGAIAKQILNHYGISVYAYVSQVGEIKSNCHYSDLDLQKTYENEVRCPEESVAKKMIDYIDSIRKEGDTIGGRVSAIIKGVPVGLGEPVFDKLEADLAKAMLSINACKGFEIGSGFGCTYKKGSEHNDEFFIESDKVQTRTNRSGGIQGGISNGQDIYFNVAFKPVSTLMLLQKTINENKEEVQFDGKGRHDPCVLPRAVSIVENMSAIIILDHLLRSRTIQL